ncbi:sulfotransferase 1E1-like isoform X2 [Coccinella septempunctata]|uniref:sulfotransferase 1E1-like isoform X2 n=1 Tax=Coccinella septempunctata TaxID=41139 RepID=UPI001D07DA38|nr:sulfotransferase 1E1-like isoform X2 [Coccinella septempunctata]
MLKAEKEFNVVFSEYLSDRKEAPEEFPFEIKKVEENVNKQLLHDFTGERTGFIQVGKKKWFFPSGYRDQAADFYNFEVRESDVWIVTFPRSGTTWTQEMVWLLANNLDYEKAAEIPLVVRFPFLEFSCFVHPEVKAEFLRENSDSALRSQMIEDISAPICDYLTKFEGRRFIKTHLPLSLLPKNLLTAGCKVIYIARNPKDVAVSFYHLNRLIRTQGYKGDFTTYWKYFQENLQPWTPYWDHVLEAWNLKHESNLLFMFYEDMVKNTKRAIMRVQDFLGTNYEDEEICALEKHLQIENFRKNSSVNFDLLKNLGILIQGEQEFIRRGKNGEWKNEFHGELNEMADKWIEENLKGTDLRFPD